MEQNLVEKIAAWTEGQFEDAALVQAVEAAADAATNHRNGFATVVDGLEEGQQERCGELITFAFTLLDTLDNELQELLDGLEAADKGRVITAGDMIHRASFQLNQTFAEFRNQALAALGPTEIPTLNHLISVKNDFLASPDEQSRRNFQESIDVERMTAHRGIRDLEGEKPIPEVASCGEAFKTHMANLNTLSDDLEKLGPKADFAAHFMALEMGFRELGDKIPAVNVALRAMGDTEFPDLNYLLSMISEAESATISDGPVVEALQTVEVGFQQTYETFKQALPLMETALAKEEVEGAIACFEDFQKGVEFTYRFFVERERINLSQARHYLLDFAKRLSAHKEKLKELEAMEGKITCPRCANVNESGRQRCSSCGYPLPQNVAATTTTTFQTKEAGGIPTDPQEDLLLTSNLVKLYEAVNAIHAATITDDAFVAEIDKFETLVNASVKRLPEEPDVTDADQANAVNQVYDAFEEGVEGFRQGIEFFRGYLDSRDEDDLKQGIKAIDQGAKRVDAAGKAVASVSAP